MENEKKYFELDGGGIVYPYLANSHWNHQFRTEAELDEPVDPERIKKALEIIRPRFPSFFAVLKKRGNSYVLETTDRLPEVVPERGLCRTFDLSSDKHAHFRVTYAGNRLGMDVFHSLADGAGANVVFINMLAEYYALAGEEIPRDHPVFRHGGEYEAADTEDSFKRVHDTQGGKSQSRSEKRAWQYNGGVAETDDLRLTIFEMPFSELRKMYKSYNTSLTVLLCAIYTKALARVCLMEGDRKFKAETLKQRMANAVNGLSFGRKSQNIKIEIPMNLRPRFDSNTLRNFSLYFDTCVPSSYADRSIEDIVEYLKPQFTEGTDVDKLRNDIYTNVSQADLPVFKALPIGLKKTFLRFGSALYGERLFTSPLSNVGIFDLPPEIAKHVTAADMMISATRLNTLYSVVLSYNGTVRWCLTSVVNKTMAEDALEKIFREEGLTVKRIDR